jgi:hypothetical protein
LPSTPAFDIRLIPKSKKGKNQILLFSLTFFSSIRCNPEQSATSQQGETRYGDGTYTFDIQADLGRSVTVADVQVAVRDEMFGPKAHTTPIDLQAGLQFLGQCE